MNAKKYPISIASYSFNRLLADGRINVFTYLEDLKYQYNVEYADIWSGFLPDLNTVEPISEKDEDLLKKVRFSMDEKGITLANLCVDGPHIWTDDKEVREKHYKGAFNYMKAAKILGAKTVRIDVGVREDAIAEDQFEYVVKVYKELAAFSKENNMRVGTENHWGASRDPKVLENIYKAVGSEAYGHLFHFGNFIDGQVEAGLETVLKMAMHTHVPANTVPYAKEYIRRLVNAGYKGAFSIEHHTGKHEYERVAWHLATVRALITELEEEGFENPAAEDFISGIYNNKK
ncbi:MAG: sugar phosphate isomerase/epimerase [Oscillospiraceae bacterium]|nr:sugar phosphate isomerase/epimerase [Oscillospiraceae bacterium]